MGDRTCVVPDCQQTKIKGRGFCSAHYQLWKKYGDPNRRRITGPAAEAGRFWAKVDKLSSPDGCWLWVGAVSSHGYGNFLSSSGHYVRAHRFSYELHRGSIAAAAVGLLHPTLDHLCRVRRCVNPEHLELVSQQENNLRSTGPSAINAIKTHCPKGHPYSGDTLYLRPDGKGRDCKPCKREALRKFRQRHQPVASR